MDPPVRDVPVTHARTDDRTRSGPGRSEERPDAPPRSLEVLRIKTHTP
ncbi:hypothetical protein ACFC4R_19980 [[Kitasatospora] papulosa]